MDRRYYTLRRKLDQHGYKQHFDVKSIDLVEKLYTDLIQQRNLKLNNANGLPKGHKSIQKDVVNVKDDSENKLKGNKPPLTFKNPRFEISALLPPRSNQQQIEEPNPEYFHVDLLKQAEGKVINLQSENDEFKSNLENANKLIDSLKEQVELQSNQAEKLTKMLQNNYAIRHENLHQCGDHLIAHLTFEIEHLQRLNAELEKRLKDVINSNKEIQFCEHKHLIAQNKQLEMNLTEADKITEMLKKQKEELLTIADKEMDEAKKELKLLYDKNEAYEKTISDLKIENEQLIQLKNNYMDSVSVANEKIKSLELLISQLKEEKNQVSANEDESNLVNIIKSLEKQRDFYKDQLQQLSVDAHQSQKFQQFSSTPISRSLESVKKGFNNIQWNALVNLLEEERDLYKKECENLRKAALRVVELGSVDINTFNDLNNKIEILTEKNKELSKKLSSFEKRSLEMKLSAEDLASEKTALQKLHEKVLAAHQQQKEKAAQKISEPTIPNAIAKLQGSRDKAVADLQRAELEVEILRSKLKLATESQISERMRLEEQIAELQEIQNQAGKEKSDLLSKVTKSEIELTNLSQENQHLNLMIIELEEKLAKDREQANMLAQDLNSKTNKSLKEVEEMLNKKVVERSLIDNKVKDLEKEIERLKNDIGRRDKEIASLKITIKVLDKDKDKFQSDVDDKTEKLAALEIDLQSKVKEIMEQRLNVTSLKRQLQNMSDKFIQKDDEILALRREVDHNKSGVREARNACEEINLKYRKLHDDLMLLTGDNQTMQHNMKKCETENEVLKREIQIYINRVSEVEDMLREKEQTLRDLLEQFNHLSATTNSLEFQNNNLESQVTLSKKELRDKEAELSRSKEIIFELNQEMRDGSSRHQDVEQQLSMARRSIDDLRMEFQLTAEEKERIQRELMALRDLNVKLNLDKENLISDARKKEEQLSKHDIELIELRRKMDAFVIQLNAEKAAVGSLEKLLAANRQKEYQTQLTNRELSDQLSVFKGQLRQTEKKLEELNSESLKYKNKAAELQNELDQLKVQLTAAQFDREKLNQEIQKNRHVYVVTTTVTETKTTEENPFKADKSNKLTSNER